MLLRSFMRGRLVLMEAWMLVVLALLVVIGAAGWGADSRLTDADRPTRWWPGTPRD
jgi:hypothetical protein